MGSTTDPGHDLDQELGRGSQTSLPRDVVDWAPGASAALPWNLVAVAATAAGLMLFALPAILWSGSAPGQLRFGLGDALLLVGLSAALIVLHEAMHAVVIPDGLDDDLHEVRGRSRASRNRRTGTSRPPI